MFHLFLMFPECSWHISWCKSHPISDLINVPLPCHFPKLRKDGFPLKSTTLPALFLNWEAQLCFCSPQASVSLHPALPHLCSLSTFLFCWKQGSTAICHQYCLPPQGLPVSIGQHTSNDLAFVPSLLITDFPLLTCTLVFTCEHRAQMLREAYLMQT